MHNTGKNLFVTLLYIAVFTNHFISVRVFMAYLIIEYTSNFYLFVSLPITQSPLIGAEKILNKCLS